MEPDVGNEQQQSINDYVVSLPELEINPVEPKTEVECTDDCPEEEQQEGDLACSYARFRETGHYTEFISFQPDSAALWPGSILQGSDAQFGFYTPVGLARGPLTFSLSLENLQGSAVGRMPEPSLSAFRAERNKILAQGVSGSTPAAIAFEVEEIHSSSQVSLALGASVLWPGGASVTAGFNFDSSEKRTKILVNYTQAYYTIDIDAPIQPADFFGPGVTVEQLEQFSSAENPPVYVQSITYGRRVIFTVESSESADKIRAALEAAYEARFDIDAKLEAEYEKVLKESTIRAFVLGGSGNEAAGAIAGFEGLLEYIKKGGDYSKDSPGAPIAYKLAYLDNAVTKFSFTTEYTQRACVVNRGRLHAELVDMAHIGGGDNGGNIEFYGAIGVRYPTEDSPVVDCATGGAVEYLWYMEDGQWLTMPEYGTWTPTTALYFDVDRLPVGEDQQLCLFAEIWEEDYSTIELSGDDFYGEAERLVPFAIGWGGEHLLQPRGGGEAGVDIRIRLDLE